jgi:hypothetical protein
MLVSAHTNNFSELQTAEDTQAPAAGAIEARNKLSTAALRALESRDNVANRRTWARQSTWI